MSIKANDVTIKLRQELDERGEYRAFTSVHVDVRVRGAMAGSIACVVVNRMKIPARMFLSAMDGHSHELQQVAVSLFEPRLGRTKLRSLRNGGDGVFCTTFLRGFLYIETLHIEEKYKRNGSSDVGAHALRHLLRHPDIEGKISSAIYILDPWEAMDREVKERYQEEARNINQRQNDAMMGHARDPSPETEESFLAKEDKARRMDHYARIEANQFLRNGFYQDKAVAARFPEHRFVVAARDHWNQPLKSHTEAAAVQFYTLPPEMLPPLGKDADILTLTQRSCVYDVGMFKIQLDNNSTSSYRRKVLKLIEEGGSLERSNAIHAACALGDPKILRCILKLDSSVLESRDVHNATPLMMAAATAAGKKTIDGYPKDQPVIDILVAAGARKDAVDSEGMTAYGTFMSYEKHQRELSQAMTGNPVRSTSGLVSGRAEVEAKLMPPDGPTEADLTGGECSEPGFINYEEEDSDHESDDNYGDY